MIDQEPNPKNHCQWCFEILNCKRFFWWSVKFTVISRFPFFFKLWRDFHWQCLNIYLPISNLNRYLALSIIVPLIKFIQTFLFAKTILCILVSIELTKKVSGNQNFSHAAPPRIIVLFIPKAKRGSCQNWPRYRSTSKSLNEEKKWKERL